MSLKMEVMQGNLRQLHRPSRPVFCANDRPNLSSESAIRLVGDIPQMPDEILRRRRTDPDKRNFATLIEKNRAASNSPMK
jgi:hypothetical protein